LLLSLTVYVITLTALKFSPSGYTATLSKLLDLAPEADQQNLLQSGKAQSILVTHYVDGRKLVRHNNDDDDDDSIFQTEGQGDLDDLFHAAQPKNGPATSDSNSIDPEDDKNDNNDTKCSGLSAMPWPVNHQDFLVDDNTSRLLCFEIASGSAVSHPAEWRNPSNGKSRDGIRSTVGSSNTAHGPVLIPGSLRERGEFSIVTVSLVEQNANTEHRRYAWEVRSVDFYNIGSYE
jgi:hypothetical protein